MALAETKRIAHVHTAPVHSLAIDCIQSRYLLSAGADTSIQLFDLEAHKQTAQCLRQITPLSHVASGSGHTRSIANIEWYPVDTGIFSTSSFDNTLRIWDTNTMAEACQFDLESRIHSHKLSPTGTHALIAAANESAYIRLCDLRTASSTQQLLAHQSGSTALAWSPFQPYILASGGSDGMLKLWDIRQSDSCVSVFGYIPPVPSHKSSNKGESPNRAHIGAVRSISFSTISDRIISTGSDSRVRVWRTNVDRLPSLLLADFSANSVDTEGGSKAGHDNSHNKSWSTCTLEPSLTSILDGTAESEIMFYPNNDKTIAVIEVMTGRHISTLHGHFAPVQCTAWRTKHMELYSSGADNDIFVWCPPAAENLTDEQIATRVDSWSDGN
ncbi:WD40-repeat-containing domain protein [Coemansia spiralis]|nr:WD40-repeat-containing domain protein [Coemansia spiralis]